jgi:hypothetical protein
VSGAAAHVRDTNPSGQAGRDVAGQRQDAVDQLAVELDPGRFVHHVGEPWTEILVRHAAAVTEGVRDLRDVGGEQSGQAARWRQVQRTGPGQANRKLGRQVVHAGGGLILDDAGCDQRGQALPHVALYQPTALGQLLARARAAGKGLEQTGSEG